MGMPAGAEWLIIAVIVGVPVALVAVVVLLLRRSGRPS